MCQKGNKLKNNPAAASLRYRRSQDQAPKLTARGKGKVAEKILKIANDENIPIICSPKLLDLLMNVEIADIIPENAFQAAAEIYAFLLDLDTKYEELLD